MSDGEGLRSWASDWADKYDQSYDTERLEELVGKRVDALKEAGPEDDGPKGFSALIVGYSVDTLTFRPDSESDDRKKVYRFSLLTEEGKQVPLLSGMTLTISEEE